MRPRTVRQRQRQRQRQRDAEFVKSEVCGLRAVGRMAAAPGT
jgi:hypothetical protein